MSTLCNGCHIFRADYHFAKPDSIGRFVTCDVCRGKAPPRENGRTTHERFMEKALAVQAEVRAWASREQQRSR